MSEEFVLHVKLKTDSTEAVDLIKQLEKHIDNNDFNGQIPKMMFESGFDFLEQSVIDDTKKILSPYSHYKYGYHGDLRHALNETADDNKVQFVIKGEGDYEITAEGQEHGADDFCTFFMMFLFVLKPSELSAVGGTPGCWSANWELKDNKLSVTFKEYE